MPCQNKLYSNRSVRGFAGFSASTFNAAFAG